MRGREIIAKLRNMVKLDQVLADIINNHVIGKKITRVDWVAGSVFDVYVDGLEFPIRMKMFDYAE